MNKDRRKRIAVIAEKLSDLLNEVEEIKCEEEEYFENMPESFQMGEKGEKAQEAISALEEAFSSLESSIENLESAIE